MKNEYLILNMKTAYRNYKIDFLRGMAILAVLILHFNLAYHLESSALNHIFTVNFIRVLTSNGNYGVIIFFVISGFLITTTSINRCKSLKEINIVNFYIFRFARIMPCLLLMLLIIVFFSLVHIPIFQNKQNSVSLSIAIFSVLTFWHNVLMQRVGYFNYCLNILWSLSVEEVFYLVFPILCLTLRKTCYVLLFLFALVLLAPWYRNHYANNEIIALYGYFSCFDAIALGCIAAVVAQKIQLSQVSRRVVCLAMGFFMIGVYLYKSIMNSLVIGISLMTISAAIYLIASKDTDRAPVRINFFSRIICWFGRNSYELYLFHIVILALIKEVMPVSVLSDYTKLIWMMVFFILSAFMAGLISMFYSQPMNRQVREFLLNYANKRSKNESAMNAHLIKLSE